MQKLHCSNRCELEVVVRHPSQINRRLGGSLVLALMAASFILGVLLARFNVFGALIATAICAVSSFICVVVSDLAMAQALVLSLATAFLLQVGYLVGQFLCDFADKGDLGL